MDRARLISIFGHDLLDDPRHLEGYRELLGLTGHKPWECVGEFSESRVALRLLAEEPSWTGARLLRALCAQLADTAGSGRSVCRRSAAIRPASTRASADRPANRSIPAHAPGLTWRTTVEVTVLPGQGQGGVIG